MQAVPSTAPQEAQRPFLPSLSASGPRAGSSRRGDSRGQSRGQQLRCPSAAAGGEPTGQGEAGLQVPSEPSDCSWTLETTVAPGWSPWSSSSSWTPQVEARVRKAAGREFHTLLLGDLQRSQQLKNELQQLKLSDYFDDRGSPRFRRLGLSFAAKQHKEIKDSFGSRMKDETPTLERRDCMSARAAHRALEAIEKDAANVQSRTHRLLSELTSMDRHLVKDVRDRQLEMLFCEVPGFADYVPSNVHLPDLLPVDPNREDEFKERRAAERWNGYFADKFWLEGAKMGWLLQRQDILQLNSCLTLWAHAARGGNCPFGMDRSTFCRFILDCGLVDQRKVPFFWAVSLFDSLAKPMRACPPDATWASTAPATLIVSRWTLISVLDAIIRQHYDHKGVQVFVGQLSRAMRYRLPAHIRADAGLLGEGADQALAAGGAEQRLSTPNSASSAATVLAASPQHPEATGGGGTAEADRSTSSTYLMPAWLRPPELPASSMDTRLERQARDRLVQSMLLEPEVLAVTAQHFHIFRGLHACYADKHGHMDFPMLLQFCTDFQFTPELVASDFLRSLYDSAHCLDWELPPPSSDSPKVIPPPEHRRGPGRLTPQVHRGRAGKHAPPPQPEAETPNIEVPASFGASAFLETLCKVAFVYLGFYGNVVQQSTASYMRAVWLVTYLHYVFAHFSRSLERRRAAGAAVAECHLVAALRAVPLRLWEQGPTPEALPLKRVVQPVPGVGVRRSRKRKTNCHAPKLSPSIHAGGVARALLFTLRLQRSVATRHEETPPRESEQGSPETDSISSSDEDIHEAMPAQPSATGSASHSKSRSGSKEAGLAPLNAGPDAELWPLEDLFRAEAGSASIVKGVCAICGQSVSELPWGNPRCRGCSVADAQPFEQHPFRHILQDKPRGIRITRPQARRPPGGARRRDNLTPPPLRNCGSRETLRVHAVLAPRPSNVQTARC